MKRTIAIAGLSGAVWLGLGGTAGAAPSFEQVCNEEDSLRAIFRDVSQGCACMARVMPQVFTPQELGFVIRQARTDLYTLDSPEHHGDPEDYEAFLEKLELSDQQLNMTCNDFMN
ncbi:hypothetical protein IHV25_09315 [Phaeovibrio sulfidiphilus]|uniref:Secreted protein n=1 Tax=Phaeovibrio sulfidiphilus TaxID=1220600 RepID=A0A8J6YN53_9PROT|nr:hypothetical protein [Phaeovibrio sulfidiphilus]MBE1237843.1 hypothetical protein [Phaeovibrio sulfidiphilus]